ncbi:bifunctional isocitrate dehydrogenase kinase/phosphatase [Gynuella sp.]|uniref:bifunctional isocitrate dehydrogenase kinase/phosphatase n=1 Tax=Gynuella sp. TaxID=2969146 RepID=UPI003D13516B
MNNAYLLAELLVKEFDIHYGNFTRYNRQARMLFETADWAAVQRAHKERIALYDRRVNEAITKIRTEVNSSWLSEPHWHDVKNHYQQILLTHPQPDLAETFYNSVYCRLFERFYYHNQNIFVETNTAWQYYSPPEQLYQRYTIEGGLKATLRNILQNLEFTLPFEDISRDINHLLKVFRQSASIPSTELHNFTIDILIPVFYRNKGAYVVGRLNYNDTQSPFIVPILNTEKGSIYADTLLLDKDDMAVVFGFARSYFFVNTQSPLALVNFLLRLMPHKSRAELYTAIGLQKAGKTEFYRAFLHHLEHSNDLFITAPGIKGMVMEVFTLPSFPYVFKVIKDKFAPQKDLTRDVVIQKYQLVKEHDRVGRMSDAWEYSHVAFPKHRFSSELYNELKKTIPLSLSEDIDGDRIVIKHCYIERRMTPLNLYLETATDKEQENILKDYGKAIRELAAANIFPGDMLLKNFGVTRHQRVIFYDFDEICYTTECNFRHIPPPRYPEDEMAAEPWYSVAPLDVFPEEFPVFLFNNVAMRRLFVRHHNDLMQPEFWQKCQQNIAYGVYENVFPYNEALANPRT